MKLQKNLLKSTIIAALVVFILPMSALAYSDLDSSMPFKYAVDNFTEAGIIEGYEDGTFKPDQPINRAEAMKIITLAFPVENFVARDNIFSDTPDGQWYYNYIIEGISREIIQGYEDGTFKPGNQVNFAESLKMALVAKEIADEEMVYSSFHYEIQESDWFAKYFKYGYDKNLFELDVNGDINPTKPMNRGEFVELMYRVKNFDNSDPDNTFDFSYNWEENYLDNGFAVKTPFRWEVYAIQNGFLIGFFKDGQTNFINLQPDSAKIGFFFWVNRDNETIGAYFEGLKDDYIDEYGEDEVEFTQGSVEYGPTLQIVNESIGLIDNYIFLDDGRILAGHGRYDVDSALANEFEKQIYKAYEEISFVGEGGYLSIEEKMELVRENILVDGQGEAMLDLFDNKELFETDTLGVGTGPVDYYYIQESDYTFKYERENDTILDVKEGQTSAF
jgi:predicted DNA-binding antitoxin AbrB/MazE fold protein